MDSTIAVSSGTLRVEVLPNTELADIAGRQFDKDGNLKQWWTNSTVREYVNRTACFVQQYNGYYIAEAEDYVSYRTEIE